MSVTDKYLVNLVVIDISEQKRKEKLIQSVNQLNTAENISHLGSWSWDIEKNTVSWSDELFHIFGVDPKLFPINYETYLKFLLKEDQPYADEVIRHSLETLKPFSFEHRIKRPDGTERLLLGEGKIITNDEGKAVKMIGTARDITEQRNQEMALRQDKELANKHNQAKTEFLANVSHELRTPLNSILGFAELCRDQSYPEAERDQFLETVIKNGNHLISLINDVLDLTKIEAGKIEINKSKINIRQMLDDLNAVYTLEAQKKKLTFNLFISPDVPALITSDPLRLRQILTNVLGNSLKFTSQGEIRLSVDFTETPRAALCFSIQDTGIGLSEDQRDQLFKPFNQLDSSKTRKYGGTGLGLVISRKLAKELGGDLRIANSAPGVGSEFVLVVDPTPYDKESNVIPISQKSTQDFSNLKNRHVLVVDDVVDNQNLVSLFLKKSGVEVDVAGNGKEALNKIENSSYDVILMDMQMPVMDGYSATKILRERGFKKPIIALTAHALKEETDRCLEVGCDEYLSKPFLKDELLSKISHYV
jgi:PAS domain S-box-containing protein